MGLIKAAATSLKTTFADQWIDYFYCESIPEDVLTVKGMKKVSAGSSNTKGSDNYITSGSVLAVADGQCMLIVEQGKIIDMCAEPGEYIFDSDRSTGIFSEESEGVISLLFEKTKQRFMQGGQTALDQRVYYFNTKEIVGNRYGTPMPIPFRVIDSNAGLDIDVSITCYGTFSYRIADPVLFYKNVTGNVEESYKRDRIDSQLESEVISVLQPAFAKLSIKGIRYSQLPLHTEEICGALNELLSEKWSNLRGLEVVSFAIKGVKAKDDDEHIIKELQRNAAFKDPTMAAAQLVAAQSDAMKAAASNEKAGAAAAFIGMGLAQQSGGINTETLFSLGKSTSGQQQNAANAQNGWTCGCGAYNEGNFCSNCGQQKPKEQEGKFCTNCGAKLPEGGSPVRFCPNCGNPLNNE